MEHKKRLQSLFETGRVSHAYVITGPGREEFSLQMGAALVCEGEKKPCGSCAHCKKTAMGIHPDIITVDIPEDKREITVDQIRQLRSDAYIRPNEAKKKVYLIRAACAMNTNAQNALLKVLEEGPAYAVFLLVADQPGALLQTVRSRCEEIFLFAREEKGTAVDERAEELADLLTGGEEYPLLRYCVGLEKLSREELTRLLEDTILVLKERIKADPLSAGQILPLIETIRKVWDAAQFNTGVGHMAGWLCGAVFQ